MNSLVLKPWRCVVFFAFIPKLTPSASGLRRWTGFAALTLPRVVGRAGCDGLRLAPEVGFLAFRLMPAVPFFAR
jgi:hypothetical protein